MPRSDDQVEVLAAVCGFLQRRAEAFRSLEKEADAGGDQMKAAVARVSALECDSVVVQIEQLFLGELAGEARLSNLQRFAAHYARLKDATAAARLARIGGG